MAENNFAYWSDSPGVIFKVQRTLARAKFYNAGHLIGIEIETLCCDLYPSSMRYKLSKALFFPNQVMMYEIAATGIYNCKDGLSEVRAAIDG